MSESDYVAVPRSLWHEILEELRRKKDGARGIEPPDEDDHAKPIPTRERT